MTAPRILLVEDSLLARRLTEHALTEGGYSVACAVDGIEACRRIDAESFDVVVSDIVMPGMGGIDFLREVRTRDAELPVILMTGLPDIATSTAALDLGATAYLKKPIQGPELLDAVEKALRLGRLARTRREALALAALARNRPSAPPNDVARSFDRALKGVLTLYQPIVRWSSRATFGFEAFARSSEPDLEHAIPLVEAAVRLDRVHDLGRAIRASCAAAFRGFEGLALLFVNLQPPELLDADLYDASTPFAKLSSRIVLGLTERTSLEGIADVGNRIASLRSMGFRIAVDDIGAGYAGLNTFTALQPEFAKLDRALVQSIDGDPRRQRTVSALIGLSSQLGIEVVAEGVETAAERDTLVTLGCDLLQGHFFARPGPPFPAWRTSMQPPPPT